jgi:hypothetical protein
MTKRGATFANEEGEEEKGTSQAKKGGELGRAQKERAKQRREGS